jgi:hypothetical protein
MSYVTEKQRERQERAQARTKGLLKKAREQMESADRDVKHIPLGQPIIVGHHSENRHRNALKRCQRLTSKACDTYREAEAAQWSARNAGHAITADDPEAIQALEAKLAEAEARREGMKEANKVHRKGGWEAIANLYGPEAAEKLQHRSGLTGNDKPFPSYALSNLGANIRRIKERLEELRAAAQEPEHETIEGDGWSIEEDKDDCRIRFYLDSKPDRETCRKFRAAGFKFSRQHCAWQRLLNTNGRWAAKNLAKELFGYDEEAAPEAAAQAPAPAPAYVPPSPAAFGFKVHGR